MRWRNSPTSSTVPGSAPSIPITTAPCLFSVSPNNYQMRTPHRVKVLGRPLGFDTYEIYAEVLRCRPDESQRTQGKGGYIMTKDLRECRLEDLPGPKSKQELDEMKMPYEEYCQGRLRAGP